jgi:hypothetical protein
MQGAMESGNNLKDTGYRKKQGNLNKIETLVSNNVSVH